jgi:valyl-tRNA synthetase
MKEAVIVGCNNDPEQKVNITPDRFEKVYYNWIDNLHDWCISRQIWWGHRLPVWYKKQETSEAEIYVGNETPSEGEWEQDPDTLDTWFSSGLWTFSTLGYPEKTKDLEIFHPTSWMQMGYELVFFWMARMILMSTYVLNQIPFKDVYIHGMLRDEMGKKFSKSSGNGIDPIEVAKQYGTDALRLSLITGVTPGNDMRFYDEKVEGARNFVNKLWNISRYILTSVEKVELVDEDSLASAKATASTWDKWILQRLDEVTAGVSENIDKYNFSQASEMLREFTWTDFADWYLEVAKIEKNKDEILLYVLQTLLKLWHPYMPFVTEKIWGEMSNDLLMVQKWPVVSISEKFEVGKIEWIKELVNSIRNLRSEAKIPPAEKLKVDFAVSVDKKELVESQIETIKFLARLDEISFVESIPDAGLVAQIADLKFALHYEAKVDSRAKDKEQEELKKYINSLETKLNDPAFTEKAPPAIIEKERAKLEEAKKKLS